MAYNQGRTSKETSSGVLESTIYSSAAGTGQEEYKDRIGDSINWDFIMAGATSDLNSGIWAMLGKFTRFDGKDQFTASLERTEF